jgi:hypothetical protein
MVCGVKRLFALRRSHFTPGLSAISCYVAPVKKIAGPPLRTRDQEIIRACAGDFHVGRPLEYTCCSADPARRVIRMFFLLCRRNAVRIHKNRIQALCPFRDWAVITIFDGRTHKRTLRVAHRGT